MTRFLNQFPAATILALLFQTVALAAPTQVNVSVKGMVCSFCAQGIKKKLTAEPAVEQIQVSLEKRLVSFNIKDGQTLADDRINTLLKDAGYTVEKIERK